MSSNPIRDLNQIYLNEVSADAALRASKKADVERGKAAAGGDREKAQAKAAQASRLYKKSGEKRKSEPVAIPDRSYPKGKGANYREDKDWGYDKKGNSLNPVDIEKRKKKDDDLAGAPNDKGGSAGTGPVKANFGAEDIAKAHHKEPMPKLKKNPVKEELQQIRALVEKEVKVKDTRRTVDAIRAYDKSKDASRDATYDTDEGDKEKAAIEKKYAAKERGEIDKDDPNWKKRKYHTGIHGEEVEILKGLIESGKFSDEEIESMAWDVYEGLLVKVAKGVEGTAKAVGKGVKAFNKADEKITKATMKRVVKPVAKAAGKVAVGTAKAAGRAVVGGVKGAVKGALNKEGYQRNPEEGERKERESAKKREAIPGQARRGMPPRGDKKREEFEKWYAANVR